MSSNQITTSRFGVIEYLDDDVVTLHGGLLGFGQLSQYLVLEHKPGSPFRWLQSVEEAEVAFLVCDPAHFCADYAPELDNSIAKDLGLEEETPRLVFAVVSIPKGKPEDLTLNLAGPILVNMLTRHGKQVVLEDPAYEIKYSPRTGTKSVQEAAA
ncbi:MAG: flagellar assembly protein FliW [Armatimonadetes bacterium]|nr:flagellar assembly protein FliW [Armatimonadota bacterium]